jgi:hypothetical protein
VQALRALNRRRAHSPGAGKRIGWGVGDQALSSMTNFALGVFVARSVPVEGFGLFTLAWAMYTFSLGGARAVAAEPLLIRFSNQPHAEWKRGSKLATGTSLAIGTVIGLCYIAAGRLLDSDLGDTLLALGVVTPGLLLQDGWRNVFFAKGAGHQAFLNDLFWGLVMIPAFMVAMWVDRPTAAGFVLAWGAAASVAAALGLLQTRLLPSVGRVGTWWRLQKDFIPSFLGDFAIKNGTGKVGLFAVTAIAGLATTGAIRGGAILMGPVDILLLGATPVAVAESVRLLARSRYSLLRFNMMVSGALIACCVLYGLLLLALPDWVGEALLRDTWEPARRIILPLALSTAGTGAWIGATIGLRALGEAKLSFRTRLVVGPLNTSGSIVGAMFAGALGAVIGNGVASWISATIWWRQFRKTVRTARARLPLEDVPDSVVDPIVTEVEPF